MPGHEDVGGVEVKLHAFVTLALGSCEWSLSPPGKSHLYPFDRRVGGTQKRSGRRGKEKESFPCRDSNPGCPARSLVTILTELPRLSHSTTPTDAIYRSFLRKS
jgi:hypothetical protein